ncbi:MAG: YkgJ family cysteine cluster protein [Desulfobulbaceae bacterium]|nr:YkgJ family cysteine cluster protein [Desulfobulbaceae bacterium]
MYKDLAPEHVRPMARGESFCFGCHPGVACFTDCCRQLELALTPYDVLRLRARLGISSDDFLERYALFELGDNDVLPRIYLAMVDDGRESCPFVTADGCSVYPDRPAACRTYPLGRGAFLKPDGNCQDLYILLSEPHCQGFAEQEEQGIDQWLEHEGLALYNQVNDETLAVFQHQAVSKGMVLTEEQVDSFILAFFNLDEFRSRLLAGSLAVAVPFTDPQRQLLADDDLALLRYGIGWLCWRLFGDTV